MTRIRLDYPIRTQAASHTRLSATVPRVLAGKRLDQALALLFPDYSRARLQQWIRAGKVRMNDEACRPRTTLAGGERLTLWADPEPRLNCPPQAIPLNISYRDPDLLVIDKPPGLVVHPGAGNPDRTLVNALLHYDPALVAIPRAGIVHRLDKDTSGLLVVARTLRAHKFLVAALKEHAVRREYEALLLGSLSRASGIVAAPLGRDPRHRTRMAVVADGRAACTHYRVCTRYPGATHVSLRLETGRTHQIRVHMASLGHPVLGDRTYGGRPRHAATNSLLAEVLAQLPRQALHAARLAFEHPVSGTQLRFSSSLPADFESALAMLAEQPHER